MKLLEIVHPGAIVCSLQSQERNGVVRELVDALAAAGQIGADAVENVTRSILARERSRGTTGFGKGAAAPHAKIEGLPRVVAAVGRSESGVDFASLDREPVFCVFLILSPAERPEEHLHAMDMVFRHLQQDTFRRFFRQSKDAAAILDLLREADERLTVR